MTFIKSFLIVLLLIPIVFIIWMNLTPGYFRYSKDCRINYFADNDVNRLPTSLETCSATATGKLFLSLAKFDLNSGNTSQLVAKSIDWSSKCSIPPMEDILCAQGYYSCQTTDCKLTCCSNTTKTYVCPSNNYVNCMPGIVGQPNDLEPGTNCSTEYLDWAKANCLGFNGPAY